MKLIIEVSVGIGVLLLIVVWWFCWPKKKPLEITLKVPD
jgi:hypothetical protein